MSASLGLDLDLDRSAPRALYLQIADGIATRIRLGSLRPGDRLPTVRELALRLEVTRPTVHKAFRELQARGWIESAVGRGSFVRRQARAPEAVGKRRGRLTPDRVLADLGRLGRDPGVLALAHAEPDPDLVPAAELWACLRALEGEARPLLQYASAQGDPALRAELARLARERGVEATAEDVVVTSGVTQALSLAAQALARPGDRVAVEEPTYLGLLQILEAQGLVPVPVPLDREGPRLDVLERLLAGQRPRFFYTIATYHNPTGRSMTLARRRELMYLAERHGLFLVEDDIYHRLAYDRPPPRPLKSLDGRGLVLYLDGLSKALLPGLRAGYVVASAPLRERLLSLRRASDLCGAPLLQRALARFLERRHLERALAVALPRYRERRDALLGALAEHLPAGVEWTEPEGGFCCWLTLPPGEAFRDLYPAALERGLLFAPGEVFLVEEDLRTHLRLCFGSRDAESIRRAVALLGELVGERLGGAPAPAPPTGDWSPLV